MSKKLVYVGSLLCVIHCILTLFIITAAPFLGHYLDNSFVEISLLLLSIMFGLFIVYNGYCQHKKKHGLILFFFGALLWVLHSLFEFKELVGTKVYLVFGTIFVLLAGVINHRLIRCTPSDCCDPSDS
tara:strand:- start:405 stop:788 length:384 start_codon:yes stop_codon:yes gene_type:complete